MRIKVGLWVVLFAIMLVTTSATSVAQVRISVSFGPPPLPVYEQPVCPGEDYIWTPGYWAWDDDFGDYYWVPGTWVLAPEPGFLWTPPYWAWADGAYVFHDGYWAPTVGFYGGIAYGFGYFGFGFVGGRWDHGHFFYNRAVMNVDVVHIHNVYSETVTNVAVNRVSYNGGPGGVEARPRPEEERPAHERHLPAVAAQMQHIQTARTNPEMRADHNHGRPAVAATPRPADFRGHGVVSARESGGAYHPPAPAERRAANPSGGNRAENPAPRAPVHPRDLPPFQRPAPLHSGNPKRDQKYQQQMEKMYAGQEQERQRLQQRQDQEHQRMMQRGSPNQGRQQQMEQRHQQQTQQMQQRHVQQQQRMQQRAPHR
jgi:hypothetical protein